MGSPVDRRSPHSGPRQIGLRSSSVLLFVLVAALGGCGAQLGGAPPALLAGEALAKLGAKALVVETQRRVDEVVAKAKQSGDTAGGLAQLEQLSARVKPIADGIAALQVALDAANVLLRRVAEHTAARSQLDAAVGGVASIVDQLQRDLHDFGLVVVP